MLASDSEDDTLEGVEEETELQPSAKPFPSYLSEKPSRFRTALTFFSDRLADISAPTRSIMWKLWILLALDSIADGMVPYTLTNYYMDKKFHLPKSTLGDITSVSYLLASFSTIFAAPLARRLGLVNTMVFTHVPSSAAVLAFPFPNSVILTVGLFFVRAGLNNMDQAPRSAFIAAAVKPEERTAVMGITSMLRTLASTAGPSITGVLAGNDRFWIAFVAAGVCRLAYDFGLYAMFINMRLHQHEEEPNNKVASAERRRALDEEEGAEVEMQKF
jgi:MFS family permease